jgi:hypothetical protein
LFKRRSSDANPDSRSRSGSRSLFGAAAAAAGISGIVAHEATKRRERRRAERERRRKLTVSMLFTLIINRLQAVNEQIIMIPPTKLLTETRPTLLTTHPAMHSHHLRAADIFLFPRRSTTQPTTVPRTAQLYHLKIISIKATPRNSRTV